MNRLLTSFLMGVALLLLLGCSPANEEVTPWFGTDITGADFAAGFDLIDHNGQPRQLSDFNGKVVAIFFGFTHCPDICPTTMADLASAMKLMGPNSDEVQVLFVTVDPERDTPDVLKDYVPHFDPRFIGLTGTPEQIAATAENFKIFYSKQEVEGSDDYSMDHSAGTYVFDKQGKVRIYLRYGQAPTEIAHDLSRLL